MKLPDVLPAALRSYEPAPFKCSPSDSCCRCLWLQQPVQHTQWAAAAANCSPPAPLNCPHPKKRTERVRSCRSCDENKVGTEKGCHLKYMSHVNTPTTTTWYAILHHDERGASHTHSSHTQQHPTHDHRWSSQLNTHSKGTTVCDALKQ